MRADLELAIRNLLVLGPSTPQLTNQITEKLLRESPTLNEKRGFLNFLIQAGHYDGCYKVFERWFRLNESVPWQEFLALVQLSGFTPPDPKFLSYLFEALQETSGEDHLTVLGHWVHYDARFATMAKQIQNRIVSAGQEAEAKLFEKLEYFRANRMITQEEQLLKELIARYPEKSELPLQLKKLNTRWAHHYVSERARQAEQNKAFAAAEDTSEHKPFAAHLVRVMKDVLKKYPGAAYDFAIGLHMMEFYEAALKILRSAMPNLATDWFRAELLLKARRYLECLDELHTLESAYAFDPESSFASTYMRAQVLRGLGQNGMAVELLKSIISVRPSYRSARGLLVEWERQS